MDFFFQGPGAYQKDSTIGKAPAFSISGRTEVKLEANAPGPGAYSPEPPKKDIAFSMSGRTPIPVESFSPGLFCLHRFYIGFTVLTNFVYKDLELMITSLLLAPILLHFQSVEGLKLN